MKITHYCNSFISVNSGSSTIVCDPWLGKADNNAWLSFPLHEKGSTLLNDINPDFIYISHLHNDHFDPKLLKKFKNKKKVKIIIKKFNNERLKSKIKELNFSKILEVEAWKKFTLNKELKITIIPQQTNNKDEIDTKIDYDLDTSILIQSNKTKKIFYNNVDNPLSTNDIKNLTKFVKKKYKRNIDVTCFPVGAASEYPHCFINVNKRIEKKRVIDQSVKLTKEKLNIIKPKIFFPAGGNYMIYGKFTYLNSYIAQPDNYKKIFINFKKLNIKGFNIEGGNSIFFKKNDWSSTIKQNLEKKKLLKKIEKKYIKHKYEYEKINNINFKKLDKLFQKSLIKYKEIMDRNFNGFNWTINFNLYKNLKVNKYGKINLSCKKFKKFVVSNSKIKDNIQTLDCYLDAKLFYCLLSKKYIWNIALSGSLVMFKRKPNKFLPDIPFSLNFLTN